MSHDENERLVHDLEKHRVELELQNRQLREQQVELETSRARWADLFDFMPVACFTLDRRGTICEVNANAELLLEKTRSALVGKPFVNVSRSKNIETFWAHLARCFDGVEPVTTELQVGEGKKTMLAKSLQRVVPGPEPLCYMALVDVTDRARPAELEASFRRLVEGVEEYAIVKLGPTGAVRTWNRGAERLYGWTSAEATRQSLGSLAAPADPASGKPAAWLHRASSRGRESVECWCVRKDGARFFAELVLTRVPGDAGDSRAFAMVVRDLSERKQTEVALRTAFDVAERPGGSRGDRRIADAVRGWGEAHGLARSEMVTAELVILGLSNKEIARKRGVSVSTVRAQVSQCFRKTETASRGELTYCFLVSILKKERPQKERR
ncbi:MAG TPA: PAS domain S-box protein [Planctomycetota bacterium]|nr:PAS domain S-box protein [Planctomycetota bacterium]